MGVDRRVLLIAYYVPPAGGPAVQRVLQFVEYLHEYGWQPEVLTVEAGAYPNRDASLTDAIPGDVAVHRTPALDPLALYARMKGESGLPAGSLGNDDPSLLERAARWIRANVFIPDARVGWWPFAHVHGKKLLDTGRFDAILSSGAPHSVHLAGRSLHRATGVPWIADLHDPWTDISYYDEFPHTDWARRLDARLETSVLEDATLVTTVSPSWAELFREKAPGRYGVVENGFDARDFEALRRDEQDRTGDTFVLSHVGKLYASRNPTAVWDALAALRNESAIPKVRVRLIGTVDPSVEEALAERDLEPIVDIVPFVPHDEALRAMQQAALLLLVIEPFAQARGMITSKLYEYLASGRPVLGVGPPGGDAHALLDTHDAGAVVDWNDARRARSLIQEHYDAWSRGNPHNGADWHALQTHNRRHQAEKMAEYLDECVKLGNSVTR